MRPIGLTVAAIVGIIFATGCVPKARPSSETSLDQVLGIRTPSGRPPAFPPNCARLGRVALVAVEPLHSIDLTAVAERYRRQFGVEVEVLPAVAAPSTTFNAERKQYDANQLISDVYRLLKLSEEDDTRWIIGITDADLYTPEREWRFCFSLRARHGAVVSTARTEPESPSLSVARTLKLITRVLAETYCGLERGGPDDSVLRPTMMGLDDLDLIDESVWIPAPLSI